MTRTPPLTRGGADVPDDRDQGRRLTVFILVAIAWRGEGVALSLGGQAGQLVTDTPRPGDLRRGACALRACSRRVPDHVPEPLSTASGRRQPQPVHLEVARD